MVKKSDAILKCPNCAAVSSQDAVRCGHCGTSLATVACKKCFGLVFQGAKFCQHCGTEIEGEALGSITPNTCPLCRRMLVGKSLGVTTIEECQNCGGAWLDTGSFNEVCANVEKQAALISRLPVPDAEVVEFLVAPVRYLPCCVCRTMMSRINFARRSGAIVDVCHEHGLWFDKHELRWIVQFIRGGGLAASRIRDL